jgi:hypothetical protein
VSELPTYTATRYPQPLREGGSLPAVVDTDGGGLFVVKFRGAGQRAKAAFGRSEPDPEIQEVLRAGHGVNVGLRYLNGAFNYDTAAGELVSADFATRLVWFDAYVTTPDRTHRNPNVLVWERRLEPLSDLVQGSHG